jgi:hypothetical protein
LSRTPARISGPSPVKGAHSWDVLARVLGMTAKEYGRLEDAGITGIEQPPAKSHADQKG